MRVVTLTEKRSHRDVLAGFLTIVFALAAWRGWANARAAAIVMLVLAVASAVFWVVWHRASVSKVTVTAEAIEWSRPGAETVVYRRDMSELELRRRTTPNGPTNWVLRPKGGTPGSGVDLFGYDVFELQRVAAEYGWQIDY